MKCKYLFAILVACLTISITQAQDTIVLKDGARILALNTYFGEWYIQYYDYSCRESTGNTNRKIMSISRDKVNIVVSSYGDTLFSMGKVLPRPTKLRTNDATSSRDSLLSQEKTMLQSSIVSVESESNDVTSLSTNKQDLFDRTDTPHLAISPQYKNPGLAYFLSLIPGGGQFYNDKIEEGFTFMISTGVCAGATYAFNIAAKDLFNERTGEYTGEGKTYAKVAIAFGVATAVLYLWQSIDAIITADRKNKMNGYVLSFAPSIMDNHFAEAVGGSGYVPAMSFNLSF